MTPQQRRDTLRRKPSVVAWLERAHRARVEQGLPEFIEDDETIDFIADALLKARRTDAPGRTEGASNNQRATTAPVKDDRSEPSRKGRHRGF